MTSLITTFVESTLPGYVEFSLLHRMMISAHRPVRTLVSLDRIELVEFYLTSLASGCLINFSTV